MFIRTTVEEFEQKAWEYGYKLMGCKCTSSSIAGRMKPLIPLELKTSTYDPLGLFIKYIFIIKTADYRDDKEYGLLKYPVSTLLCVMPEDSITSLDEYFNYLQFLEVTE